MYHYIYKITNDTGDYYIGKRSCADIESDSYMGSGLRLREQMSARPYAGWKKTILSTHPSAQEAYDAERHALGDLWLNDPKCLNLCPGGEGGYGLCEKFVQQREEYLRLFLAGENLPVQSVHMSHDELALRVMLNTRRSTFRGQAAELLSRGFYFGQVQAYRKVGLRSLDVAVRNDQAEYTSYFERGELPPAVTSFLFCNHELMQWVRVDRNNRTVSIAQRLLASGWACGGVESYKRVKLSDIGITVADDLETLFLAGEPCPVSAIDMNRAGVCVHLARTRSGVFNPACAELYERGWRFGCKNTQRKVGVQEALDSTPACV